MLRALILAPNHLTFAHNHCLIVNRIHTPISERSSVIPPPANIERLEMAGVSIHADQWPPGLTCVTAIRICTKASSSYIAGSWTFAPATENAFRLECTRETLNLHVHMRER